MPSYVILKARNMPQRLQKALTGLIHDEFHALTTYAHQASIMEGYGHQRLAQKFQEEVREELHHAMLLMDRLNLFASPPNLNKPKPVKTLISPKAMLQHQLELEEEAIASYNKAVALARSLEDNATKDLLTAILQDEEHHYDWLSAQLDRIAQMGLENYLSHMGQPHITVEVEEED